MAEVRTFIGKNSIIESGSVIIAPGDEQYFSIEFYGLQFTIKIVTEESTAFVEPQRVSSSSMLIKVNARYKTTHDFKFKVGTLWDNALHLAAHVEMSQDHYLLTYTFSIAGP